MTPAVNPSPGGGTIMGMLVVVMSLALVVTSLTAANRDESNATSTASVKRLSDENSQPRPDGLTLAQTEAKEESQPPTNPRSRIVEVLDEDGQSVVGAEVRLQFMHDEDGGYYVGDLISQPANEKGIVEIAVPEDAGSVSITVVADGFNAFSERQAAAGSSSIRLKRGRSIHVRAVDEAGKVLIKAVPLLAGHRVVGREFVPQEDGTFKSPSVDLKRRLMRVVSAQENGPLLFSQLVDVAEEPLGANGIHELVLKAGSKITGRLDDSVPRPISEGYAELMIVEGPNHQLTVPIRDAYGEIKDADKLIPWTWEDSVAVQADGTFVFESVPSGGIAQLHVVADGYMSANPSLDILLARIEIPGATPEESAKALKDQIGHFDMWPILFPLDGPNVDAAIPCEPTASCDFRILDPSGNPLLNAAVSFSPNGVFISGKLFLLGSYDLMSSTLVNALFRDAPMSSSLGPGHQISLPENKLRQRMKTWADRSFSGPKSDADGRVKIRNLPGGGRESFNVWASGFVLPKSQLFPRDHFPDHDRREAYVNLIAGETIESTIYLDRDQPVIEREVLVMDDKGNPLRGITISLSEMRVGPKDWQLWSVQRFGAVQTAKSDENGRVVLSVPNPINNIPVERLRLAVNYEFANEPRPVGATDLRFWVSGGLVDAPLTSDEGFVAIIRNPDSNRSSKVIYGTLTEILATQTPEQLLSAMIRTPNLAILRQLLASAKSKQPEPIELLDEGRFSRESKGIRVRVVGIGDKSYLLVPAKIRPVDGTRQEESDFTPLPECVFVFDADGRHVASLGGEIGTTGAGSADNVDILCLGPEEDWFVRVTRFQDNGPFVYQSVYYRIGESIVPSLKYHHYANSNAWSNGPEKITRHGDLYFEFPDSRNDRAGQTVGVTPEGVAVNGIICWDGDKNQFFGAPALSVNHRSLYKVDTEWSQEFLVLNPKSDQMVLSGGIREYDHWYGWNTVVPAGYEANVRVSIPQATGEPQIMNQKLVAGRYMIQLQAKPSDDGISTKLELRSGEGENEQIQNADLPFKIRDQQPVPAIVNLLDAKKSIRLLERPLEGSEKTLTLEVSLQPLAD